MITSLVVVISLFFLLASIPSAAPLPYPTGTGYSAPPRRSVLAKRQYIPGESVPYFPDEIPSCRACGPEWTSISSCAQAAPAFEDWKNMLFNPASFYNAIKCACTDTFSSAYPQCVDCFVQTNQCQEFLGVPSEQNSSSILDGLRNVCGFGSTLVGNVAKSQSEAGIAYTYTGVPSQGYSISTTTGVGGLDYGSAQGGSSGGANNFEFAKVRLSILALGVACALLFT
ncbi:hypothetical protein JCM11491_004502 [Sporobolomyces phaffii]